MTRINTNVASLRGLRSLQKANSGLDSSLQRLSTGLKVNSGKDNPSGLIAGETLRSQITTIEQSIKNSNRANNVISTADSALGEIGGLLNQVRGLVQEGINTGALSQQEIQANQLQIDAALSAINRISANTSFAGDKLIDGSKAFVTTSTSTDAAKLSDFSINEALFGSSSTITLNAEVTSVAEKASLRYGFVSGGLASNTTVEVSGAKGNQVVFLGATSNLDTVLDAINSTDDITGVIATKTNAVAGTLVVDPGVNANDGVTITDKRAATGDQGLFTQKIKVVFTSSVGATLGVTKTSSATSITITVELATGASGTISSTATQVAAALNTDDDSKDLVSVVAEGTGGGTAATFAKTAIADGTNAYLTLSSSDYGSNQFVDINVLSGTFATTLDGTTAANRDTGVDIGVRINGQQAQGKGLTASVKSAALDAAMSFTEAANTASNTSALTITGGGTLFQIGAEANASGQIGIGIEAINTARLGGISGKLYELGSGAGKSLLDVGDTVNGDDLVSIIDDAISKVSNVRGRLGAIQKNVIDTNISVLGVALENISEARSQIMDTDFAEETANLTKGQILSQAGISVLSIANQNPSQVLSLLG
ncbi:MAG: flagellin [Planctomycetota bacterium]|nr:flagellin [Planctomycetota bacterium]MDA1215088.1 flagellin [Planctomycetota bacterium]